MIIEEIREVNGREFCYHSSSNNKMIKKVGTEEMYYEAYDIIPCKFEYEETDIDIETENIEENDNI